MAVKKIFIIFTDAVAPIINRLYVLENREGNAGYVDGSLFQELSFNLANSFKNINIESFLPLGNNAERIYISQKFENLIEGWNLDIFSLSNLDFEIANDFKNIGSSIPLPLGLSGERIYSQEIDSSLIIFISTDSSVDYEFINKNISLTDLVVMNNQTVELDESGNLSFNQMLILNEDLNYNNSLKELKQQSLTDLVVMNNDENCSTYAYEGDTILTVSTDVTIVFTSTNALDPSTPPAGFYLLNIDQIPSV